MNAVRFEIYVSRRALVCSGNASNFVTIQFYPKNPKGGWKTICALIGLAPGTIPSNECELGDRRSWDGHLKNNHRLWTDATV